jgi:hypothetical protein
MYIPCGSLIGLPVSTITSNKIIIDGIEDVFAKVKINLPFEA